MKETEGSALSERQRYWLEQVRASQATGKTIAEYAANNGMPARISWSREGFCRVRSRPGFGRHKLSILFVTADGAYSYPMVFQ